MWQAIAALFGAAFTAAACYATGAIFIDRLGAPLQRRERVPLAFVLGAACLHLAILALHIAYWPVLVALLAGVIAAALRTGSWRIQGAPSPPLSRTLKTLSSLVFTAYFVLYLFHAWAPEMSPDGASYHLGLVARYLRVHGFERITTNIYANLGAGIEMLFVPAFAIGRHSAGALVHLAFSLALGLAIFAYGSRLGKPWVGVTAAALTFLSPVVGLDGASAYNDVGVAAVVFSVFYWVEIWNELRDNKLLIPIGLLAGYSYAAKYTAFTIAVFAIGFVWLKTRKLRPALAIAALSLVMAGPWVVKNVVYAGNPVAPLGNWLFRNPNAHVMFEKEYTQFLRTYNLDNKWTLPLEVTVRGQKTTGLIGPAFLLLPVALLSLRYRAGRHLWVAGLLVFSTYFGNIGTRFLIPCLPFFSLALAMALGSAPPLLAMLLIFHGVTCWPRIIPRYASPYAWRLDKVRFREALRIVPQDKFLRENYGPYGIARMVEANVPKGERVFAQNGVADSYTTREVLVSFQSGPNEVLSDALNMGWSTDAQPSRLRVFTFPERSVRRLRVMQTTQVEYPEQWNVHEIRFFRKGVELPRATDWRLRAWPNPWDVQLAFDNSPATRWRSWETAFPGMYLDTEFGKPESIDEVRIETSPDYLRIQLQLEVNEAGAWTRIASDPEERVVEVMASIRRAATFELHARGVNYVLMGDQDYGAEDMRDDPESWGLQQVAAGYGERLYKVTVK